MRINVYAEEITNRVEMVEKNVNGKIFYGVRFYLEFFGPPSPGQSWSQFQSMMSTPIVIGIGSGMAVAIAVNPLIGLLVGGVALLGARARQKSKNSGGY